MTALKAAVIGLGVGEAHAKAYARLPETDLVALCDIDRETLRRVAASFPGVSTTTRPGEVFDDPSISIVSIASYDDAHAAQVIRAIESGKHVFVEKPLCLSIEEAARIRLALSRNEGLLLGSNLVLRASPLFRGLRDRIREGELGRVYLLEGSYEYGRIRKITEGWRGHIPFYSVFGGGGLHILDIFLFSLPEDRVEAVSAVGTRISTEGTAFRHFDTATALFEMKSGAIAKVTANFSCVYPHFHRIAVYGTKATFENDLSGARIIRSRDPDAPPEPVTDPYPGVNKGDLIPGFVEAIRQGTQPNPAPEHIFHEMAVLFAVERSMREKRRVEVREIEEEIQR